MHNDLVDEIKRDLDCIGVAERGILLDSLTHSTLVAIRSLLRHWQESARMTKHIEALHQIQCRRCGQYDMILGKPRDLSKSNGLCSLCISEDLGESSMDYRSDLQRHLDKLGE